MKNVYEEVFDKRIKVTLDDWSDSIRAATSVCRSRPASNDIVQKAIRRGHESLLEHTVFHFTIEGISRVTSHQLVRHRLASYAQQSQRHVKCDFWSMEQSPLVEFLHKLAEDAETLDAIELFKLAEEAKEVLKKVYDSYEAMAYSAVVPLEVARYILPNETSTVMHMTVNGRELKHFYRERYCSRAQGEIRVLARKLREKVIETKEIWDAWGDILEPGCVDCPEPCGTPLSNFSNS